MAAINKPSQSLIPPTDIEEVEEIATSAAEAAIAADDTHAPLVENLVPAENLPSYVDDVLEFADVDAFPEEGETGKIYVALDTNFTYRWSGSTYIQVGGGSGGADTNPHHLTINAHVENNTIVIDDFHCDELPDNTWFESTPASLLVALQVSGANEHSYFYNDFHAFLVNLEADVVALYYDLQQSGVELEYSFEEEQLYIASEIWLGLIDENGDEMVWFGVPDSKNFYWYSGTPLPVPCDSAEAASVSIRSIEPALRARNIIQFMSTAKCGMLFSETRNPDLTNLSDDQVYDIIRDEFVGSRDPIAQYLPFTIQHGDNDGQFKVNDRGTIYTITANDGPFFRDTDEAPFVVEITSSEGDKPIYNAAIYYNLPQHLFSNELNLTYNSDRIWDVSEWLWLVNQIVSMQWNVGTNSELVCHDQGQVLVEYDGYIISVEFGSSNGYITYTWDPSDPKHCTVDWSDYHLPSSGGGSDVPDPAQAMPCTFLAVNHDTYTHENILTYSPAAQYGYLKTSVIEGFTLQDEGCDALYNLATNLNSAVLQQITVIDSEEHKIQNIKADSVYQLLSFDIEIDGINYSFSIEYQSDPR